MTSLCAWREGNMFGPPVDLSFKNISSLTGRVSHNFRPETRLQCHLSLDKWNVLTKWNSDLLCVCVCVRVVEDGAHPGLAAPEAGRGQEVQQPFAEAKQQQHQGTARPLPAHQPLPVRALAALLARPVLQPDLTHPQCKTHRCHPVPYRWPLTLVPIFAYELVVV